MDHYVRIECEDLSDAPTPLFIDAIIDDVGHVRRGPVYAGWWGRLQSTDLVVFLIRVHNGRYLIDTGSDEETDQATRYEDFYLFDDPIYKGRKFVFPWGDDEREFVISKVTDLIAKVELTPV